MNSGVTTEFQAPRRLAAPELAAFAVVAVVLRVCLLIVDHHTRFFLGDSESYLATGFGRWIPNDRSWLYGLCANALLGVTHHFSSLIALQSLATAGLAACVAAFLRGAGVRAGIAWAALLFVSAEPTLLYYDRSVMTDQLATVAAGIGVILAITAWARPRWTLWLGSVLCFLAAATLRTALVPLVLWVPTFLLAQALTAVACGRRSDSPGLTTAVLRSRLSGSVTLFGLVGAGLAAYSVTTGAFTHSRPSLNPRAGYFMVGIVSPILVPEDFAGLGIRDPASLLEGTGYKDRNMRNCQVFCLNGVAPRLEAALGDWRKVSRVGSVLARRSVLRDPLGFAALCLANTKDYLAPGSYRASAATMLGLDQKLPPITVTFWQQLVRDRITDDLPAESSPVLRWVLLTLGWLPVLCWLALGVPGVALAACVRLAPPQRMTVALLATSTWVYLGSVFVFSLDVASRYLLPAVPLVAVLLAIGAELAARVLSGRRADRPVSPP